MTIRRFSSRREKLDRTFLAERLKGAKAYDRIAGYFSSSLLEIVSEELETVAGKIRMVCNSELDALDVQTARAAQAAVRREWCASAPEKLLEAGSEKEARNRFRCLYDLLKSGKIEVRVLPDHAFGLMHGKAGVITLADGSKTSFVGSTNESKSAWKLNYELVWEDTDPETVRWVEEEFEALWSSPFAVPLAEAVVQDIGRLAERHVIRDLADWNKPEVPLDPAPALIETPVYRKETGLWEHQKFFVKTVLDAHRGPPGKARFVLADQVGLGKTIQLAMVAQLIALTGNKPILIIAPKTILRQWQAEMLDLLDMPSAVWNGKQWVDERGIEYPVVGPESIRKCPRRVGIISSGLISRKSEVVEHLFRLDYDCVILDEAHRARRRNLGRGRENEKPDPNNLLAFMHRIAEQTRSLLLATATPVQLYPVEAWDLLDVLSRGDLSVLGNVHGPWRKPGQALALVMGDAELPVDWSEQWEWVRNPLPPKEEHPDFEILRRRLGVEDGECVVPGDRLNRLGPPEQGRVRRVFPRLIREHNPFICRIIRRTREQLEKQIDPETHEPLLKPIKVVLHGEEEKDALFLPTYMREAYERAEEFSRALGRRLGGSGFLKTLLLRRVGSSIHAGLTTARKMLSTWESLEESDEEDIDERIEETPDLTGVSRTLTAEERRLLEAFVAALETNREEDPKYRAVRHYLGDFGWLVKGCIIFSQYRDSIQWLAGKLTEDLPEEPIALYSGPSTSGIMQGGVRTPQARESLKQMVQRGQIRLLLGTDAASEGLNLQKLARLINLDLPWNPTRLEQRKGRIQRIGQVHDEVEIYNIRYKDSVEDRVHQLLSERLQHIHELFGQVPDVLEDVWVYLALGEKEAALKIIDAVPTLHPFELRYGRVEKVDWESCTLVLSRHEKYRVLSEKWS